MQEASFSSRLVVTVPFSAYDRRGTVQCYYGTTPRAADRGFPALSGWNTARRAGVGFPTIKCELESDRPGYWSMFGWIQWVTQDFPDRRRAVRLVDRPPAFLDRDLPFATMGYTPTFFDAPAYLSLPAIEFRASLFLCTLPMMSRREHVAPLAGFNWGYRISRTGEAPTPYPLELASEGDWARVRSQLSQRHPRWRFARKFKELAGANR